MAMHRWPSLIELSSRQDQAGERPGGCSHRSAAGWPGRNQGDSTESCNRRRTGRCGRSVCRSRAPVRIAQRRRSHHRRAEDNFRTCMGGCVRGHGKVPTDGQVEVPGGGQVEVPAPLVRRVVQELEPWAVTVMVPVSHVTTQGAPLKLARERMKIIAAYQEVGTYRGAADICGTTHKTVKRVIERAEAGETAVAVRAERPRNYDPVAELVTTRVKSSEGRMSAKRLLPIAQAAGYDGSARNFRRLVAAQKALWRRDHHRGRRPAVWTPGEYLVIDWATVGGGLHLFCAVLAWSRWRFVAFATDERATTTLALIAEALAAAGGVPLKVLADRMACLKGGVVANVVIPTPDYVRFAAHYGFAPDFCHANDPESKGIVENLVGYAQRDLVVPLLTEAEVTGRPVDVH